MSRSTKPVGIGVIGTGMISNSYLQNLVRFPDVKVLALADLDPELARKKAEEFDVPTWGTPHCVLEHDEIEIVINLTIPKAHVPVALQVIAAGKHVWSEKPIGVDIDESRELLESAERAGLRVGVAPDTILNPGTQSARRLISSGAIGEIQNARTVMRWPGPDSFHPNADFLFAPGGGPLLDMGPYYLSALVSIFGSVARVYATGSKMRDTREIRFGPRTGEKFPVDVFTHVESLITFESGATAMSTYSNDVPVFEQGVVEINGTEGLLLAPDPMRPSGDSQIVRYPVDWAPIPGQMTNPEPIVETYEAEGTVVGRGIGVLEMARAIREDGKHTATGDLAFHVLDTMLSIQKSAELGVALDVESTVGEVPLIDASRDPFAATL